MFRKKSLLFCALISLFAGIGQAQKVGVPGNVAEVKSSASGSKWLRFKADGRVDARSLFTIHGKALGLGENDRMALRRTETDQLGYTHYRYQQTYKGINVEGAEFVVHEKDGRAERANGTIISGLQIDTNPLLSEEKALRMALDHIDAERYMWQDSSAERFLQREQNNDQATFYPKAELIIAARNYEMAVENFRLAYRFDIYAQIPLGRFYVDIDAQSGEVINRLSRIRSIDVAGTGATLYNGNVNITVDYFTLFSPPPRFRLREDGRGNGIQTYNMQNGTNYGTATDFEDTDVNFTHAGAQTGVSAHWGAERTYDYFLNEHGRNSFNGSGGAILNYVHANLIGMGYPNNVNAFWDGARMTYGDGDATRSQVVSLDVIGHEFTHGVNDYSADLIYRGESGALDESFSDIFGTAIEFHVEGTGGDWDIGEDIYINGGRLRSMSNPNAGGQPDTYGGQNWLNPNCNNPQGNDWCGVHTNSGVQNFWFFLLSQGGNGTNDNGDAYSVAGIGIDKAADIAYRNLTQYLTKTSGYFDARMGSSWAAEDLYGIASNEVAQVANAWYAVGVVDANNLALNQNQTINTESIYLAPNSITAGPYTIKSSGGMMFFAGNAIKLSPGFTAQSGCQFRASILGNNGNNPASLTTMTASTASMKSISIGEVENVKTESSHNLAKIVEETNVSSIPIDFGLSQNYPNPFNPETTIRYQMPEAGQVTLRIYDLLGEEIVTLLDNDVEAGYHQAIWNGKDKFGKEVASGIYLYRLEVRSARTGEHFVQTRKMSLLR